jgi:hypothetical protein
MIGNEENTRVAELMQTSQGPSRDEWRVNLQKDGGRRVMYGGNAYEDDLEPDGGPGEPAPECPAPAGIPS